jgi:membrane protease YdiL (CAAX protease family)
MPIKLTSKHYRIIAIALAVAAVSLGISIRYFSHAFPEASLDMRVSRGDSERFALGFLGSRGIQVAGYHHAVLFNYDDASKLYIERTQGLQKLNRLTRGPIHLWRWSHRWFRPLQQEEFRVNISPTGDVIGFAHEIPEAAPGANLPQPQARTIAEQFLTRNMLRNLNDLEFMDAESEKRPARTDHVFTWKVKSVDLGDGSLRVQVGVDGDQVSGYREFVKVPEQWSRDYERIRSRNESAQIVDEVVWVLLSVAMLVFLIQRLRDRDVPLRLAVWVSLVGAVLMFLGHLNTFGQSVFEGYRTTDPYGSFLANYVVNGLLASLGLAAVLFLLVAASEPMYREGLPPQLSLRRALSWEGLRTRSFLIANVVGLAMTFFFFAYQTIFYLAANRLGAWAPTDIPFSNELNTHIPWVSVLFMGFMPAITEEMQFRAFAIPFLHKITRSLPVAIVLAAFNWGFLHAAYPNEPFFIRGVEVGLGGIIVGVIMYRFGIVATLIWHYSVDALYTAFLLLRSSNHYLKFSGAATAGIMLIPLIVALVAYWRSGTFVDEEPLTNEAEGVARVAREEEAAREEAPIGYVPLDRRRLMVAAILTVIFLALAVIPVYQFGQNVKLATTRAQAVQAASQYLRQKAINPDTYQHVAWLQENIDADAIRYLLERRSIKETDRIYQISTRPLVWQVRYFRPLERAEHTVFVDVTSGHVFAFRDVVPENAPGASLAPDQARALSETALQQAGYNPADFELQDSQGVKRPKRVDYQFVWQAKAGDPRNVDGEHYRVLVAIAGDQAAAVLRFFKLPEEWQRAQHENRLGNVLLQVVNYLVGIGIVAGALVVLVQLVRSDRMRWRFGLKVGALIAVLVGLTQLNRFGNLLQGYETAKPLSSFYLTRGVGLVILPLMAGLGAWLLVSLAVSLYPNAARVLTPAARCVWRRDAVVAIVLALAALAALAKIGALLASRFHAWAPVSIAIPATSFDAWSPGLEFFVGGVVGAISGFSVALFRFGATILAILIYLAEWGARSKAWWAYLWGALLVIAFGPVGAHTLPEFFFGWLPGVLGLVVAMLLLIYFLRDNVAAYLGVLFCLIVADPLLKLLSQPIRFYRWNGALLAILSAAMLAWLLAAWRRAPAQE